MESWALNVWEVEREQDMEGLVEMLGDSNWLIRCDAIQALERVGANGSVESVVKALDDSSSLVRAQVARALGGLGYHRAVEPLIGLLPDNNMRIHAIHALGMIGQPAVQPLLNAVAANHGLCLPAAEALRRIGDNRAVRPLIEAISGKDGQVAENVASALGRISTPSSELFGEEETADGDVRWKIEHALWVTNLTESR